MSFKNLTSSTCSRNPDIAGLKPHKLATSALAGFPALLKQSIVLFCHYSAADIAFLPLDQSASTNYIALKARVVQFLGGAIYRVDFF